MRNQELFSVVISTYNNSSVLLTVLEALAAQFDKNFEVIIADDGSKEEHVKAVLGSAVAYRLGLTHVWHPDVGFTVARVRNLGVRYSKGSTILLLDGDCIPEVDWVAQHRRLQEDGYFVNGSRVLLSPSFTHAILTQHQLVYGQSWGYWVRQRLLKNCNKSLPRLRFPDGSYRIEADFCWKRIRSCNFSLSRKAYETVNGFDETFEGWGHEDADFVLRLHNAGLRRKNGVFATEVYHLWHSENARDQESINAQRVKDRMSSQLVKAEKGWDSHQGNPTGVRVTKVGH